MRRIGAEQELFLIEKGSSRPSTSAIEVLKRINDPHFTTELAKFNLEVNLEPIVFARDCLSQLESQLDRFLAMARSAASRCGADILLTGILPTLRKSDLGLEKMTPSPRYQALNRGITRLRGGPYEFRIKGVDELLVRHDSVMVESCNASFQVHLQTSLEEFPNTYNVCQAVAGPVLAAASNSPLLFGHRLWSETRITLFEQAVDSRGPSHDVREMTSRVHFGRDWIRESVVELFQEDVARFKVLAGAQVSKDSVSEVEAGTPPELKALCLHNSTIWRWNRPCYGITDGKPHLRIENRYLPSGPTIVDEVANAAFWLGLVLCLTHDDIAKLISFEDTKANFFAAARLGLSAELTWLGSQKFLARELICKELLPKARAGLERSEIDAQDIDKYLGLIDARVGGDLTGSAWILGSLDDMKDKGTRAERMSALAAGMAVRQKQGLAVSRWTPARLEEAGGFKHHYLRLEQFMSTDLYTVREEEPVELVASLMDWEGIRHVPVEDGDHRLVGVVSYDAIVRLVSQGRPGSKDESIAVREIMNPDPVTVSPDTPLGRPWV